MDRVIVYPSAIPLETDILRTGRFGMVAVGKVLQELLGATGTVVAGFATTPTSPASMQVSVGPGDVLSLQNVDGTAFSDLAPDLAHAILKQGLLLDPVLLTLTAPTTTGQSITYLVQVAYQDSDTDPGVLPYYNAANPAQPFTGPAGSGATQPTSRKSVATVTLKAGVAAATGSQVAPAPDAGFTAIYTVNVANGQTTVTSANIAAVATAPFLAGLLNSHHSGGPGQAPQIDLTREVRNTLPLANLPASVQAAASGGTTAALQSDIATLAIRLARLQAATIQLPDGFDDAFTDTTGVDASRSTNVTYNSSASPKNYRVGGTSGSSVGGGMTSNTTPAPNAAYLYDTVNGVPGYGNPISPDSSGGDIWTLFDGNASTYMVTRDAKNAPVRDYGAAVSVNGYTVTDAGLQPTSVNFCGSNDGQNWTIIDSQTGLTWTSTRANPQRRQFNLSSAVSYRYYGWALGGTSTGALAELAVLSGATAAGPAGKLTSVQFLAATSPSAGAIWLLIKAAQAPLINSDIVAKLSRNDGAAFVTPTLSQAAAFTDGTLLLQATGVDLTGQTTGTLTQMRYEIDTTGAYEIDVLGVVYRWG